MEAPFFSFITSLIASGAVSTNSLIVIVILLLCVLSYYIFRPMFQRVKDLPSKEEVNSLIESKMKVDAAYINDLNDKLDKLIQIVDEIEHLDENNNREIQELRRDIETIKQILNQFQGHMLFSRNDFGNKELK